MSLDRIFTKRNSVPGSAVGIDSMEDVWQFNRKQVRRKGFNFSIGLGANDIPITLSGTAKMLLGIAVYDETANPGNIYQLTVNNDTRVETTSSLHLSRIFGIVATTFARCLTDQEYYPIYCPLNGNDSIALSISGATAGRQFVEFYYI